jgi:predicted metal-dependent phosphoesterase TrpH
LKVDATPGILRTMTANRVKQEAALAEQVGELRDVLSAANIDRAECFYEVGVHIRTIEDEKDVTVYGERAIERLADELGRDAATLRRFAAVARKWPRETFAELSRRPNAHGLPLTWEHWMELAPHRAWEPWLARTLAESWSVEELKRELPGMM